MEPKKADTSACDENITRILLFDHQECVPKNLEDQNSDELEEFTEHIYVDDEEDVKIPSESDKEVPISNLAYAVEDEGEYNLLDDISVDWDTISSSSSSSGIDHQLKWMPADLWDDKQKPPVKMSYHLYEELREEEQEEILEAETKGEVEEESYKEEEEEEEDESLEDKDVEEGKVEEEEEQEVRVVVEVEERERKEGILSDKLLSSGLSYLTQCPVTKGYILAKLCLSKKNLMNIDILGNYRYLQYINLSHNQLTDLTPLGRIPYLMHLDVSYNKLTAVLRFKAPWNLTFVDFSHNEVGFIHDLTDFWSITNLNLSHNKIKKIEGLQNLRYLQELDLSFNQIERFENLSQLRITTLYLQNNLIHSFEQGHNIGMKTLLHLTYINLSNNRLTSLGLFKGVYHLKSADLMNNLVTDLIEMDNLSSMMLMRSISLTGNPLTQWQEYRGLVLHTIPSLVTLDNNRVSIKEKVAAKATFGPDIITSALRVRTHLLLLDHLNHFDIDLDIMPIDQGPYPIIILVGPMGCRKGFLTRKLAETFPDKVRAGVSHTTRPPEADEIDGINYHFITQGEFNDLAHKGAFLSVSENAGNAYGFCRSEITRSVQERRLCIIHMDLQGALVFYAQCMFPRMVLTISQSKDVHLERLRLKYTTGEPLRGEGAVEVHKRTLRGRTRASVLEDFSTNKQLGTDLDAMQLMSHYLASTSCLAGSFVSRSEIKDASKLSVNMILGNILSTIPSQIVSKSSDSSTEIHSYKSRGNSDSSNSELSKKRSSRIYSTLQSSPSKIQETKSESNLLQRNTITRDKNYFSMNDLDKLLKDGEHGSPTFNEITLENIYIRSVLQSRATYFKLHEENPGLFSETIYTDDLKRAYRKLIRFVKNVYRQRNKKQSIFKIEKDVNFKEVIPEKLNNLMEEINQHHKNSTLQKSSSLKS